MHAEDDDDDDDDVLLFFISAVVFAICHLIIFNTVGWQHQNKTE